MASVARALGVDAAEVEPAVDPPAAAGDLQAEIEGFTTVEACVTQHAHLDPLLGDALEAIGYDTFVRDACRALDAAKARDARPCQAIDASSLRRQCEATVAAVAGDADACPWSRPSRPEDGRDAFCLAVAAGDPRLCAGQETRAARATCDATVRHDPGPCGKLPARADQDRCRRDVERWRGVVATSGVVRAALAAPEGTLHVDGGDPADGGVRLEVSLQGDLARGVVLLEQRDGTRFDLGPDLSGGSFIAASPHTSAALSVEIFAGEGGKRVSVGRAALSVPGRAPLATPLARSSLTAQIDKLDPARGGAVRLTLEGDVGDSTGTFHVRAKVTTFVRDVVTARAAYGAAAGLPRFGDAGAMR